MRTVRTAAELGRDMAACRERGATVGQVGTSGALHEGHLALIRRAAVENDVVVLFWTGEMSFPWAGASNPSYPRDKARDAALAEEAGADVLYIPDGAELFPRPPVVRVTAPALHRPGLTDPAHLDVVALFCTRFLSMVGGCRCYMGEKDWQQLVMMREIVRDLSLPVSAFVTVPTVRDPDGVPKSSRNEKLDPDQRRAAAAVPAALRAGAASVEAGERDPAVVRRIVTERIAPIAPIDYVEVLDETLHDVDPLVGPLRLLASARFGDVSVLDTVGVRAG